MILKFLMIEVNEMPEKKKAVYKIITDIWDIIKKYAFTLMNDEDWENMHAELAAMRVTHKSVDDKNKTKIYTKFYDELSIAFIHIIEVIQKEAYNGKC